MDKAILLIDFGSTFTKLTAVDVNNPTRFVTAKGPTTVQTDINIGLQMALEQLEKKLGFLPKFEQKLACSSAAGGLNMIAIGLVPELTLEAAKMAALGAGAKLQKMYSYKMTKREVAQLEALDPDIILLAGGTDGGNKEVIIHNGNLLAKSNIKCPVIIAGNKNAEDELDEVFEKSNIEYHITDNVLPGLNKLNVDPAREKIREVFLKNIIEAKGIKKAEEFIDGVIMPTPQSVLKAGEFLSEQGIIGGHERIMIVDIGGATTDVHSFCKGEPKGSGVILRGLPQPFAKRTVEGDLGLRYSVKPLIEAMHAEKLLDIDQTVLNEFLDEISKDIWKTNSTTKELELALAKGAVGLAVKRHAGNLEIVYTPHGTNYVQYGKDLSDVELVIGTGGPIVNSDKAREILEGSLYNENDNLTLKPKKPQFVLDKGYVLSAIGLLSGSYPDIAKSIAESNFTFI